MPQNMCHNDYTEQRIIILSNTDIVIRNSILHLFSLLNNPAVPKCDIGKIYDVLFFTTGSFGGISINSIE